jgi:hypothetical protein
MVVRWRAIQQADVAFLNSCLALSSRQMLHFSTHAWPYPAGYTAFMSNLKVNSVLAAIAVFAEFLLGFLLIFGCYFKKKQVWIRRSIRTLCISIHVFAALALNVWFFGFSMIAQIIFLTAP